MEHAGNILNYLILKNRWTDKFALIQLKKDWEKCVGRKIAKHTKPDKIVNKKLIILMDSPIWGSELNFLKEKILNKINGYYNQKVADDIIYKAIPSSYLHKKT